MFPIALDLSLYPVILVGNGQKTVRRLGLLEECGAQNIRVFSDQPSASLQKLAGARLVGRLPEVSDLAGSRVMMVVDIAEEKAIMLAERARAQGLLVNVEDKKPYCDFHFPSFLKRGDLLVAVSSGGKSPTLSRTVKQWLAGLLDKGWADRLETLAAQRQLWQQQGRGYDEIKELSEAWIKKYYDITL